jgi:hypothetical protein
MKAYLVFAGLVLGLHGTGGLKGWWKSGPLVEAMSVRGSGGGGSSGWSGGGFRGGK